MKNSTKKNLVCGGMTALSVLLGASAVAAINPVSADAAFAPTTFEMKNGAAAVLYDNGGLRFIAQFDKDTMDYVKTNDTEDTVKMGFIIGPKANFTAIENDADAEYYDLVATEGKTYALDVPVEEEKIYTLENDTLYYAHGCVWNIKSADANKEYTAIAYIKDGDTVHYAKTIGQDSFDKTNNTYSQYYILNKAVFDANKDYTDQIMDNANYQTWFGTEDYPIEITEQSAFDKMVGKIEAGKDYSALHMNVGANVNATVDGSITLPTNLKKYVTYKVEHYTQNTENDNYSLKETVTEEALLNATVADQSKTITGYTLDTTNASTVASGTATGDNALTLKYYYTRDNIKEMRFVKETATDTYQFTGHARQRSHYYRNIDTKSTTAVYSVRMSADAVPVASNGDAVFAGIALTDGTEVVGDSTLYKTIMIGINKLGLVSVTQSNTANDGGNPGMFRRLDGSNKTDFTTVNSAIAFTESSLTRTLTLVLYEDTLFMYVDGALASTLKVTDTGYFNTGFAAGTAYAFGITGFKMGWMDANKRPTTQVLTEEYGDKARAIIEKDYVKDVMAATLLKNATKNTDGSYTLTNNWMNASYAFSGVYSNMAVYKISMKRKAFTNRNGWEASAGIMITNGQKYSAGEQITLGNQNARNVSGFFGITMGFRNPISSGNDGLYGTLAGLHQTGVKFENCNAKYFNATPTEESTHTITVVLYNGNFYFYADDAFNASYAVNDSRFAFANTTTLSGSSYGFTSTDKFMFGAVAANTNNDITVSVVEEYYGEDALTEITTNSIYSNIGA